MKRFLIAFLLLFPLSASASVGNDGFWHLPTDENGCDTSVTLTPSPGNFAGDAACTTKASDYNVYWNLDNALNGTSYDVKIVSADLALFHHRYLYFIQALNTSYGETCPGEFRNDDTTLVAEGHEIFSGLAHNADGTTIGSPSIMYGMCQYDFGSTTPSLNLTEPYFTDTTNFNTTLVKGRIYAMWTDTVDYTTTANTVIFSSVENATTFMASLSNGTTTSSGGGGSGAILGTCGTFDVACMVSNVTQYVFIPTDESIEQFQSLSLASSSPFSYLYDLGNVRDEFFNTATTSQLGLVVPFHFAGHASTSITLISKDMLEAVPMANTVRTIIGWLMWFLLAELVYYQLLRSHNKETQ